MTVTLQRNSEGLYCSELILEKYQIMQSSVNGEYYIWNHERNECHLEKNGSIDYYSSIEDAMAYLTKEPAKKEKKIKTFVTENVTKNVTQVVTVTEPIKKESKIKPFLKRMPGIRKPSALSLMRELIQDGILNDEDVAQKILDTYPNSPYSKHMVKFQRKKMDNENGTKL